MINNDSKSSSSNLSSDINRFSPISKNNASNYSHLYLADPSEVEILDLSQVIKKIQDEQENAMDRIQPWPGDKKIVYK